MAKFSIKDKITDTLGNEIIGSVKDKEVEEQVEKPAPQKKKKPKKAKPKKPSKPKKEKKPLIKKPEFDFKVPEFKRPEKDKSKKNFAMKQLEKQQEKRKEKDSKLLDIYNIEKVSDLDGLVTDDDISNVEFDLIAPTGLDPKQVAKFLNSVSYSVSEYRNIIKNRDREIDILSKANSELEDQLEEEKQSSDFAQMINTRDNREAEMQEKVLNLQLENEELKNKYLALKQKVESIQEQRQDTILPEVEEEPKIDIKSKGEYDGGMSLLDEL